MGVWDRLPQALRKLRILRRMTQRELATAAEMRWSRAAADMLPSSRTRKKVRRLFTYDIARP